MSKTQQTVLTTKVQRASKFLKTGVKIGGNYIKHYSKKMFQADLGQEELDSDNAKDIYQSLSELKGSALKVAQMLSMDKNILPTAYQEQFVMSQYSAPPLSYPLVVKTFKKYLGKTPSQIFDKFTKEAVNAASIGQVHKAWLNNTPLAVKVQYPGVSESIRSDLKIVRPIAFKILKMNASELEVYMEEVESKLIEETNYELELERSISITKECGHIEGLEFPTYYPKLSSNRILVMSWIDGLHLKEWLQTNPTQKIKNIIGQTMWDFYDFQIHKLRQVHADPHPGNFLVTNHNSLAIIDFGCVKVIPEKFYNQYFQLMRVNFSKTDCDISKLFLDLGFISQNDTQKEKEFFIKIFIDMIGLLSKPFHTKQFNFGNDGYFNQIYEVSNKVSKMKEVRNSKIARGNKHGLYINRTYFGLYNLLNMLRATVNTENKE